MQKAARAHAIEQRRAKARAHAIDQQQAKARATARAEARAAARTEAHAKALAATRAAEPSSAADLGGHSGSIQLLAKVLLGVAAVLLLLALAPTSAAYTFGPRAGHALAEGRFTLAGIGAALAIGMVVALFLGGAQ